MVIRKSRIIVFSQWYLGRKHADRSDELILKTQIADRQIAF
jgi:hypothetical protein